MQGIQPLCRKLPYTVSAFSYGKTGAAPIATARLGNHHARNAVTHSANPGINEAIGGSMSLIQFTAGHRTTRSAPVRIVGADSVLGRTVIDRQRQRIGELRDIMLDLSTGRIAYAVIAVSLPSDATSLIVVPWNAVHPDHASQRPRINAHADWIARAPSVQEGSGPERFVQDWGALIHSCFGTRPYWEPSTAAQYS